MTTKKSSDRPYMSEYDKTVEERLQALESKVQGHDSEIDEDRLSRLETRFEDLLQKLYKKMSL
jgi:hypothetical protein